MSESEARYSSFLPDINDELLVDNDSRTEYHTFNAIPCQKCGRTHDFWAEGVDFPEHVRDTLSQLLDAAPDDLMNAAVIDRSLTAAGSIESFTHFGNFVSGLNANGAMTMALAHVLDDQTNGEVTRMYDYYMVQKDLVVAHILQKIFNNFVEGLTSFVNSRHLKVPLSVQQSIERITRVVTEKVASTTQEYKRQTEALGLTLDQSLIDTGIASSKPYADMILRQQVESQLDIHAAAAEANPKRDRHHHVVELDLNSE